MPPEQADLLINLIDLSDEYYRISDPGGEDFLAGSIGQAGLISPPLIQQKSDGQYRIISGFRRIFAVGLLGWPKVACLVLGPEKPDLSCWKMAVADNALSRTLSLMEQARAASGLMRACGSADQAVCVAKGLGLSLNADLIRKLTRLMALPEEVRQAVARGRMSLNIAMGLETIDHASAGMLAGLFMELRPTVNHQQEFFTGLHELACLRRTTIASVLQDSDFASVLSDSDTDRREKLRVFRKTLRKLRFPELSRAEDLFDRRKKNLGLPDNMNITAPAGFEGTVYTLTVRFSGVLQLCKSAEILAGICRHPDLEAMLRRSPDENP